MECPPYLQQQVDAMPADLTPPCPPQPPGMVPAPPGMVPPPPGIVVPPPAGLPGFQVRVLAQPQPLVQEGVVQELADVVALPGYDGLPPGLRQADRLLHGPGAQGGGGTGIGLPTLATDQAKLVQRAKKYAMEVGAKYRNTLTTCCLLLRR
jgi:hypothetical protein